MTQSNSGVCIFLTFIDEIVLKTIFFFFLVDSKMKVNKNWELSIKKRN